MNKSEVIWYLNHVQIDYKVCQMRENFYLLMLLKTAVLNLYQFKSNFIPGFIVACSIPISVNFSI